ncbi:MAG TPA: DMT family transporter [Terracidiphilus sp.]|jgi:transporter family-2 protein|nr:DMT family transporter [Terracidiphilus sp.]
MRALSYFFGLFLGIILTLHLAMNGEVGAVIGNPRVANAFFWSVGAIAAIIIGLTGWQPGVLDHLRQVHPALMIAGAIGACLVFAIAWMLPQVGARGVFITLIAGQVLGGMIFSHFGWLGSPVQRVTLMNALGAVLLMGGAYLATYVKP